MYLNKNKKIKLNHNVAKNNLTEYNYTIYDNKYSKKDNQKLSNEINNQFSDEINNYDELILKIKGIKIFVMIIQNEKKYKDYKFNKNECINLWTKLHILCHKINNEIKIFNNLVNNNLDKILINDNLSYEINFCIKRLKDIKKFDISQILNTHIKRRVYLKYALHSYNNGSDIQLIHPLTSEKCEISYHNGHHHIFVFEGNNYDKTQLTLDENYQFIIEFDFLNDLDYYKLSTQIIYKYLNNGYIPTVKRNDKLLGYDHFCSQKPLNEVLTGDSVNVFDLIFED